MRAAALTLICVVFAISGCGGPPLQKVHGVITLDGKPLKEASLMFQSDDEAHYAMADTDEEGRYELVQDDVTSGLPTGKYLVTISTYVPPNDQADPPDPGREESVPERYNVNSELYRDVTAGDNKFDFKLESP